MTVIDVFDESFAQRDIRRHAAIKKIRPELRENHLNGSRQKVSELEDFLRVKEMCARSPGKSMIAGRNNAAQ